MSTRSLSWNWIIGLAIVPIVTSLVLLIVMVDRDFSERSVAASLLILGFVVFGVGGMLFTGRVFWKWPAGQTVEFLRWERVFVIAAILGTVLGLALLDDLLADAGDSYLSRLGLTGYLVGAVVVVVAETDFIHSRDWNYAQVVLYVVLAFLAQAAIGVALIQTDLVAGWVGWLTVIWNLAWLAALPIISPQDLYYPVLRHVAPLFIGIALLI